MSRVAANLSERAGSQTVKALLAVREWILSGDLTPGERISELSVVDRIGISRTPVRAALMRLEEEGLLEAIPTGGYAVRLFTEAEILDAIEIRGTLEGLGARLAAERGQSAAALKPIRRCLAEIDDLVGVADFSSERFQAYVALNARFHRDLLALAGSATLERQLERATATPFASPSAFVMAQSTMREARAILTIAQDQHRIVVEAIENREGARAEAVMREHARVAIRNLRLALGSRAALDLVPGAALIAGRDKAPA